MDCYKIDINDAMEDAFSKQWSTIIFFHLVILSILFFPFWRLEKMMSYVQHKKEKENAGFILNSPLLDISLLHGGPKQYRHSS